MNLKLLLADVSVLLAWMTCRAAANKVRLVRHEPLHPDSGSLLEHSGTLARHKQGRLCNGRQWDPLPADAPVDPKDPNDPSYSFKANELIDPVSIAIHPNNDYIVVADKGNNVIRRVTLGATINRQFQFVDPVVSTIAGGGWMDCIDGQGTLADFESPDSVALSPDGAFALVCDEKDHEVRKVGLSESEILDNANGHGSNVVSFVGSGTAGDREGTGVADSDTTKAPWFNTPSGIVFDALNIFALIADTNNHKIKKVHLETSVVTTLAGNGNTGSQDSYWVQDCPGPGGKNGSSATFNHPHNMAMISDGSYALVTDTDNALIRKVTTDWGVVQTLAGPNEFSKPMGVAIAWNNSFAVVADAGNHKILKINLDENSKDYGSVTTFAGSGGPGDADGVGTAASFNTPTDIKLDSQNAAFAIFADSKNNKIKKVNMVTREVTTLVGPSFTLSELR